LSSPVIGLVGSYERLPDGFFESHQSRRYMCAEMDAQNSPIALCQYLEIAARASAAPIAFSSSGETLIL
jgi:hypothetical protein